MNGRPVHCHPALGSHLFHSPCLSPPSLLLLPSLLSLCCSMMEANPMMRNMLSNPDAMRALLDPANLQAMQQMAQAAQQLRGALPGLFDPLAAAGEHVWS